MRGNICEIHGLLELNQISLEKSKKGYISRRCKLCRAKTRAEYIFKNDICKVHGKLDIDLRYKDGSCKLCARERSNKWKKQNRAVVNERAAKDREKNPEKWDEIYKNQYKKRQEKYGSLLSLHKCCEKVGITVEDYQRINEEQKGLCAICHTAETRICGKTKMLSRLVLDHCHKTNKFRGLICHNCNTGIGKFQDSTVLLYRAIRYLKTGGFNGSQ